MWARVAPHPALEEAEGSRIRATRVAPISLFLREHAGWLLSGGDGLGESESLSHAAREMVSALGKGALFLGDLIRSTDRLPGEAEDALWELVAAGLVTADGFENLRALIDPKRRRGDAAARRPRRNSAGRWALVPREPLAGRQGASGAASYLEERPTRSKGVNREEHASPSRVVRWCEQLLVRWGVLWRDLLAREAGAPPWREVLPLLRRMEAQGQIRGGRFVEGFTGEQFARPEAIDLLRAVRRSGDAVVSEVGSADPLNLAGIILPGARVSPLVRTPLGWAGPGNPTVLQNLHVS
jgi:ATP-dependent Lhr-like helicase